MKYDRILDATLIAVIAFHLMVAPYTKVEESFNMQAIYDIINYGIFPRSTIVENYDHVQFPGVVPQTFVGSLVLAGLFKGLNFIMTLVGCDLMVSTDFTQKNVSLVVRAILGLLNALSLMKLRDSVNKVTLRKKLRGSIGFWFIFLLSTQFYLLYYCSRTIPNFIALPVVLMGISKIVEGDISGLVWFSFAGIVFGLEAGMFGGLIALVSSLIFRQSKIHVSIIMLVSGTILGLLATVVVDSYFWGRLIVPEVESFVFNIMEGKSAEWGVESWSSYFFVYLLELFGPPIILWLAILGFFNDPAYDGVPDSEKAVSVLKEAVSNLEVAVANLEEAVSNSKEAVIDSKEAISNLEEAVSYSKETVSNSKEAISNLEEVVSNSKEAVSHPARHSLRILFVASVLYIVGMSFQPHKEWRFIIYVVPIITLQAANGFANLSCLRNAKLSSKLKMLSLIGICLFIAENALFYGYISSHKYPGAEALNFANEEVFAFFKHPVLVHMDVTSFKSGINRFGELHNGLAIYDKTESKVELLKIWNDVEILITETNMADIDEDIDTENIYNPINWLEINVARSYSTLVLNPIFFRNFWNKDLKEKFTTILAILKTLVRTKKSIYVYLRVMPDEGLENKLEIELKRLESDINVDENLGLREEGGYLVRIKGP